MMIMKISLKQGVTNLLGTYKKVGKKRDRKDMKKYFIVKEKWTEGKS